MQTFAKQLTGIAFLLIGAFGIIIMVAIGEHVGLISLLSLISYLVGALFIALPSEPQRKVRVFIAIVIAPLLLFLCFYLLDVAYQYGLRIPFIVELVISISVSALISLALSFAGENTNN